MSNRSLLIAPLMALVLGATACSASTDPQPPPTPAGPANTNPEPPAPEDTSPEAVDPKVAACDAENAKLQAGVDKAHKKTTEAVLAVKTEACGATRVIFSGPSKIGPENLHRIGSITKTFVAGVILSLAKDGALTLDDKVSKWVTDLKGGDGITIRQLMNHSSGLFNYTDDLKFQATGFDTVWKPREIVAVSEKHDVYFEPGKGWHYSNTNYILLGMIAELAGKAKIGVLVRERVLKKANLNATFFDGEETVNGTMAPGQSATGKDATKIADPSWAWAAGAIVATPSDVVSWVEQLGSGTFYDAGTQQQLLTPVKTENPDVSYGLGIMLFGAAVTGGGGEAYGHGGDIQGYHTQAFYFPQKKTTVVSIVDSDAESPNDISIVALDTLFK